MNRRIGFIGVGNMGGALVRGIVKAGIVPAGDIFIYDTDTEKAAALRAETGVQVSSGSEELMKHSDVIVLAVKPAYVKKALESCKQEFGSSKVLVSVAAGVPVKTYKDILGAGSKVVRTMPNTPALVGEGMTLVSFDETVSTEEKELVKGLFRAVGKVEELEERLMSEVIALTGSSPAYVFMFIEAMADAAVLSGIPRALAYKLASQAVLGSAKMVLETGKHPGELKDQVCSPAGTTIEAVAVLEKTGFRSAVIEAMNACTDRAREIGRQTT